MECIILYNRQKNTHFLFLNDIEVLSSLVVIQIDPHHNRNFSSLRILAITLHLALTKLKTAYRELYEGGVLPYGSLKGFTDDFVFPECLICKQPLNILTQGICNLSSCSNKHVPIHTDCMITWISYKPGERIVKAKSQCPVCKVGPIVSGGTLKLNPVDVSGISDADLQSKIYLKCKKCSKLFISQHSRRGGGCSITGEERITTFELECDDCTFYQIVKCIGCGNLIERIAGCDIMTCCIRGTAGCLKEKCPDKHGSNGFVTFCGTSWRAIFDMTASKLKKEIGYIEPPPPPPSPPVTIVKDSSSRKSPDFEAKRKEKIEKQLLTIQRKMCRKR